MQRQQQAPGEQLCEQLHVLCHLTQKWKFALGQIFNGHSEAVEK